MQISLEVQEARAELRAERKAATLTPAQIKLLKQFDSRGLLFLGADPYRNKGRVLDKLAKDGLVSPYRHGGYEITEIGRAAIATH